MQWIDFDSKQPPWGEDVLVLKTYLDAPYGEHGYENDKEFWIKPIVQIDNTGIGNKWGLGGKALYWMPLPETPA